MTLSLKKEEVIRTLITNHKDNIRLTQEESNQVEIRLETLSDEELSNYIIINGLDALPHFLGSNIEDMRTFTSEILQSDKQASLLALLEKGYKPEGDFFYDADGDYTNGLSWILNNNLDLLEYLRNPSVITPDVLSQLLARQEETIIFNYIARHIGGEQFAILKKLQAGEDVALDDLIALDSHFISYVILPNREVVQAASYIAAKLIQQLSDNEGLTEEEIVTKLVENKNYKLLQKLYLSQEWHDLINSKIAEDNYELIGSIKPKEEVQIIYHRLTLQRDTMDKRAELLLSHYLYNADPWHEQNVSGDMARKFIHKMKVYCSADNKMRIMQCYKTYIAPYIGTGLFNADFYLQQLTEEISRQSDWSVSHRDASLQWIRNNVLNTMTENQEEVFKHIATYAVSELDCSTANKETSLRWYLTNLAPYIGTRSFDINYRLRQIAEKTADQSDWSVSHRDASLQWIRSNVLDKMTDMKEDVFQHIARNIVSKLDWSIASKENSLRWYSVNLAPYIGTSSFDINYRLKDIAEKIAAQSDWSVNHRDASLQWIRSNVLDKMTDMKGEAFGCIASKSIPKLDWSSTNKDDSLRWYLMNINAYIKEGCTGVLGKDFYLKKIAEEVAAQSDWSASHQDASLQWINDNIANAITKGPHELFERIKRGRERNNTITSATVEEVVPNRDIIDPSSLVMQVSQMFWQQKCQKSSSTHLQALFTSLSHRQCLWVNENIGEVTRYTTLFHHPKSFTANSVLDYIYRHHAHCTKKGVITGAFKICSIQESDIDHFKQYIDSQVLRSSENSMANLSI